MQDLIVTQDQFNIEAFIDSILEFVRRTGSLAEGWRRERATLSLMFVLCVTTRFSALAHAQLPGIGAILAQRIIESRQNEGPFVDHDDLLRVRGIGPKRLDRLRPYLSPIPKTDNLTEK